MIELKNVTVRQKKRTVIKNACVRLPNGKTYAILSQTAGDADALLSVLAGSAKYEGSVKINGYDLRRQPTKARACLGFLPAGAPTDPSLTSVEALEEAADAHGLAYERGVRRIHEVMEATGLEGVENRLTSSLSDVDRYLLGISLAMIGNGDLLMLSDPLCNLDARGREEIAELISRLREVYTVFLSVACEDTARMADTFLLIDGEGNLIEEPSKEAVEQALASLPTPEERAASKRRAAPERDGEYELIKEDKPDA